MWPPVICFVIRLCVRLRVRESALVCLRLRARVCVHTRARSHAPPPFPPFPPFPAHARSHAQLRTAISSTP